jgi:RNA polymerase sigma factor (sigma-70 family)
LAANAQHLLLSDILCKRQRRLSSLLNAHSHALSVIKRTISFGLNLHGPGYDILRSPLCFSNYIASRGLRLSYDALSLGMRYGNSLSHGISALEQGDLRPDQVKIIARRLGVTEQDVVDMNRRLGGDVSLNTPIREEGDSGEWQDWLVDEISDQETRLAEREESDNRRKALGEALCVLNDRERRIFEARRLVDDAITLEDLASEFGISRERVRQIEVRAFQKVQRAVKNRVAAIETWSPVPVH